MTIRDQLAHDLRFAQREFEQARHPLVRSRRRIDDMQLNVCVTCRIPCSNAAAPPHPTRRCGRRSRRCSCARSAIDRFQRTRQFRSERHAFDDIRELEQLLHDDAGSGFANEFRTLRPGALSRDERPLHMHAGDLLELIAACSDRAQHAGRSPRIGAVAVVSRSEVVPPLA